MGTVTKARIIQYLDKHNFKHSNAGFMIIVDIVMAMAKGDVQRLNISNAYKMIAEQTDSTKENVEKSIRFAIKNSECNGMTNKEFLCRAYDEIVFEEEEV